MIQWAAFTDMVATRTPERTGLSYGLFGASGKIGLAIGGLTLSAMIAGADSSAPAHSTLARLMAVIPALGAFIVMMLAVALFLHERRQKRAATDSSNVLFGSLLLAAISHENDRRLPDRSDVPASDA
jgi:Na+/melibiose symporter-like transporter